MGASDTAFIGCRVILLISHFLSPVVEFFGGVFTNLLT
jgi:hypothetical protein